ncbi:MAG: dimethylmenaquinone methyltransferase [Paenarthrobacter ureafaciens]|uniref:RraA family protein n=1 Tax=Paenarthrobacter ureafaciens TaxID=37931 RepID=UPI001ACF8975|nr:dimethylmenaquinone methyltransferase [Paenarthrobacter ureafaciens]MBN9128832.1 dimethylmenaquinone methyltransferase [Paenarthrobacter ureafaciens]
MSADAGILDIDAVELLSVGSATLYEASKNDLYLDAAFRPSWDGAQIVGRALPVAARLGDNLALHWGVADAEPGDVLMVDAGGGEFGYWGEVMAVAAQARGIAGLVIDGGVRDTRELAALGFPAFSTSISIRGTEKQWPGTVGRHVTLRGRVVARGDLVVADRDGVCVIPAADVSRVIEAARERVAKEDTYMERLRNGELTVDVYGFRALGSPLRDSDQPRDYQIGQSRTEGGL